MFVKMIRTKIQRSGDDIFCDNGEDVIEQVYDVNQYSLFVDNCGDIGSEKPDIATMCLNLYFKNGTEKDISFPKKQEKELIEIFVTNEEGKTVEKYRY